MASRARPRLLDLFSGGGGAAVGYHRAGFDVVGVDHKPMPHYPFEFYQADALTFPLDGFDAIHASPPCQAHSSLRHLQNGKEYPDLIPQTRARLVASGLPYVIENVDGAPLGESGFLIMLCGTMFKLRTPDGRAELRRHRLFELSFSIALRPACQHGQAPESLSVNGTGMGPGNRGKEAAMAAKRSATISVIGKKGLPGLSHARRVISVVGGTAESKVRGEYRGDGTAEDRASGRSMFTSADARAAMGIDWLPMKYLSQAIPPAYTEFVGRRLMEILRPAPEPERCHFPNCVCPPGNCYIEPSGH